MVPTLQGSFIGTHHNSLPKLLCRPIALLSDKYHLHNDKVGTATTPGNTYSTHSSGLGASGPSSKKKSTEWLDLPPFPNQLPVATSHHQNVKHLPPLPSSETNFGTPKSKINVAGSGTPTSRNNNQGFHSYDPKMFSSELQGSKSRSGNTDYTVSSPLHRPNHAYSGSWRQNQGKDAYSSSWRQNQGKEKGSTQK